MIFSSVASGVSSVGKIQVPDRIGGVGGNRSSTSIPVADYSPSWDAKTDCRDTSVAVKWMIGGSKVEK